MRPWLLQALNPVFPKPLPQLEPCFRIGIITTSPFPPHPAQERKSQKSKESNFYLVKANVFQKKPDGQGAVIWEPLGPHRDLTLGKDQARDTEMSSAIQHHPDKLCGEERWSQPRRGMGRGTHGPGDHKTMRVAGGNTPIATNLGSVSKRATMSDQFSLALVPLPPAVSPHPL